MIVPTRRAADGSRVLALPKGHVDPGETRGEAALREVREETGVDAALVDKLGDVRYWYLRDGRRIAKVVSFFLFEYVAGELERPRPRGRGGAVDAARGGRASASAYPGEREMVARRAGPVTQGQRPQ